MSSWHRALETKCTSREAGHGTLAMAPRYKNCLHPSDNVYRLTMAAMAIISERSMRSWHLCGF